MKTHSTTFGKRSPRAQAVFVLNVSDATILAQRVNEFARDKPVMNSLRPLGRSSITLSPVGLGCWQFSGGRGLAGGYWLALPQETVNEIVAVSLAAGVTWFDTAELYGRGRSETALAQALTAAGKKNGDVVVATKWWPMWRTAGNIKATIAERLARLAPFGIDLYQIHQPFALASTAAQMRAMADLVADQRIRTVGVSNFSATRMRAAHRALAARGIPLVSNQVRYSLLDRRIEKNGVLETAKELGITIIAYSPLAQGILSGKFHRNPSLIRSRPGPRKWMSAFRHRGLERSRPLVIALEEIARAHAATPSQVALNWLMNFHGDIVVVIPGATSPAQAAENVGATGFRLSDAELKRLDELSRPSWCVN
jgi:aryl-alcohol dehydrogenase-like predicted oxidoreductase